MESGYSTVGGTSLLDRRPALPAVFVAFTVVVTGVVGTAIYTAALAAVLFGTAILPLYSGGFDDVIANPFWLLIPIFIFRSGVVGHVKRFTRPVRARELPRIYWYLLWSDIRRFGGRTLFIMACCFGLMLLLGWRFPDNDKGTALLRGLFYPAFIGVYLVVRWACLFSKSFGSVRAVLAMRPAESSEPEPVRGARLLTPREAALQICSRAIDQGQQCLVWAGFLFPKEILAPHYLVFGTAGSGKTLVIRMLMPTVFDPKTSVRALVYDPKPEFYPVLLGLGWSPAGVILLNPFDARGAAWHIAADVTTPAAAREIAAILLPSERQSSQPYFLDSARDLVRGVMDVFNTTAPLNWTLNDVLEATSSPERLRMVLEKTQDGRDLVKLYLDQEGPAATNILSTIRSKLSVYETIARAWRRCDTLVSIENWAQSGAVLVLGGNEQHRAALDAINRAIFQRASELIVGRPDEYPADETWFFIDEAREAGRLDGLRQLLNKGRSKGAHVVLGFQDLDGLRNVYGKEQAEEMLGLCGNVAVLRLESPATQEWAAKYFGEYEFEKVTVGQSHNYHSGYTNSLNVTVDRRFAILPQQFRTFPPASLEDGFTAVISTPAIGAWRHHVTGEMIGRTMGRAADVPAFVPRPVEHQSRMPWTDEDLRRLRLTGEAARPRGLRTMDP